MLNQTLVHLLINNQYQISPNTVYHRKYSGKLLGIWNKGIYGTFPYGNMSVQYLAIFKKCKNEPKACELIGYSWSSVRPSSSVVGGHRRSECSKSFFSKAAWPIKAKFYEEPPWVWGTKVCSRHLGHMTKMAATPIYGKNPSKVFSRTAG